MFMLTVAQEQAQRAAVVAEAETWLGTPFLDCQRVKGAGVDCAMILAEVFATVGFTIPPIPSYSPTWMIHQDEPIFVNMLLAAGCRELKGESPRPGDIGMYHFGRCYAHSVIVAEWPKRVIHALYRERVLATDPRIDGHLRREVYKYPPKWFSPWPARLPQ
jgi:hypothetical protein